MSNRQDPVSYQGHYAGSVSRFAAYAVDLAVSSAVFSLTLAVVSYAAKIVTGHEVSWNRSNIVIVVLFVGWQFVYFGYSWAVSGRTFGMAALAIRVNGDLRDLADQLIGQLAQPAVTGQPRLHRRSHIPAGGLTVYPRLSGHLPQACARKPGPEHFTDLSHGNLPECHPQNPQVDRPGNTGYRK